jgi:hypothetical protein
MVVETEDLEMRWTQGEAVEPGEVDQVLTELEVAPDPVPQPVPQPEPSVKLAAGSAPVAVEGIPLVQPDRKRPLPRPSMKAVLAGEIDNETELDVPAFLRRHGTTLS